MQNEQNMRIKLIKLLLDILAVALGACLCFFFYDEWRNGSGTPLFIIGALLFLCGSALFLFLWIDVGNELRHFPLTVVYILTCIFFGIPQLLLGLVYIVFVLGTAFPIGLFTLHKTLPKAGVHFSNAFSWPGRPIQARRLEQPEQSSGQPRPPEPVYLRQSEAEAAALAGNIIRKSTHKSNKSKRKDREDRKEDRKAVSEPQQATAFQVHSDMFGNPAFSQIPVQEMHDYASYFENLNKKK